MNETEYRPRAKWWGFVAGDFRYLMRYHHTFAIFSKERVLWAAYETKTDKQGVEFALRYFTETIKNDKKEISLQD